MILLLVSPAGPEAQAEPAPPAGVIQRTATDLEEALGWAREAGVERVVVRWPTPGFNPFALARRLREGDGPRVVLTGPLRPETRFWAERNGCDLAADLAEVLGSRGDQ